jgi:iron complex outermembrane receptor protein
MPAMRSVGTARSVTFISALLMSTAFTVPAYAEIETVVVTAERKAEDIQTVPIAVTALTGADLKSKQVNSFRDLQFHVPSVTYTKSNFGGAQFQIRGITTQFGLGAAIAQNQNDIYLEAPSLVTGQYFDVDRVEVARGPQSTSYGRAATGGAVNIITSKPNLDEFQARASFDYGSFNTMKPEMMVNVPLIDGVLGIRFAALGVFHDGYEKNQYAGPQIYPGVPVHDAINGQGTAGGRLSVRWEPNADTTIDLTAELGYENDSRVRGDKQECHRDPSGVVGCLPDRLGFDPINLNSTLGATLGSKQGLTALMSNTFGVPFGTSLFLGNLVGLFNLGGNGGPGDPAGPGGAVFLGPGSPGPAPVNGVGSGAGGVVSPDLLTSNTAFNPKYTGNNAIYTFNWSQNINSWLKSTVDFGYTNSKSLTRQDYNDGPPPNISALIGPSVAGFNAFLGPLAAPYDAAYFNVPGSIPISSVFYNGTFGSYGGIIDTTRGGILTKTPFFTTYDEDNFSSRELTGEVRFQTSFEGPINFSAGAFWMSFQSRNQYWVASSSLDFEAIAIGGLNRALTIAGGGPDQGPIVTALPTFDAEYRRGDVQSRSAFVEGTWDVIPDSLKVIVGARYNDDRTSLLRTPIPVGGGLLTNGFALIGSTTVNLPVTSRSPTLVTGQANNVTDLWTGRATINWTPKLSWTDQTLVYATASRGELAGGINVANNAQAAAVVPTIYQPATVDAVELGTKNTLLDGTLQANLDVWYYNYENYQVGIIANRQALTLNIPAHLMGFEGEFVWQPEDDLAFNLTLSLTRSAAGTSFVSDERNPTGGVPNNIFVKDLTNGSNCVVQPTANALGVAATGHTPGESSALHTENFYLPNGGNAAIDAPFGIPLVNYGICSPTTLYPGGVAAVPGFVPTPGHLLPNYEDALEAKGFQYTFAVNPKTGAPALDPVTHAPFHDGNGNVVNLHGNQLPQVPNAQIGVGAQWTAHLGGDFTLVPRVDYYWQSSFQSRVWNDANIDRVNGWDTMNAQIQLNAPENKWYARVFATNLFDKRNPTGVYLTDPTSALYTNVFSEDPRVLGVSVGASW